MKVPRFADPSFSGGHLSWRFSMGDRNGPWPWTGLAAEKHLEVIARLAGFETLHPHEVRESGSHPVALNELSPAAMRRLQEIEQDDLDTLMSFRLTNTDRVWCVQDGSVMRVLWWDPNHEVCPSLKRNT